MRPPTRRLSRWRFTLLAIGLYALMLPLILAANAFRARYGGADFPLWYLVAGWLLLGVLWGIHAWQIGREPRGRR